MLGHWMGKRIARFGSALIVALALVGSCSESATSPKAGVPGGATSGLFGSTSSSPTLLACPTNDGQSASTVVGPLGATLSLGGTIATVPSGVLTGQTLNLSLPAGNLMEVDLSVNDGQHVSFDPSVVTVIIDYSRCNRNDILQKELSVWTIDESTKAPIEKMPSVDNKLTQSITFTTTHFSGFAVAY